MKEAAHLIHIEVIIVEDHIPITLVLALVVEITLILQEKVDHQGKMSAYQKYLSQNYPFMSLKGIYPKNLVYLAALKK